MSRVRVLLGCLLLCMMCSVPLLAKPIAKSPSVQSKEAEAKELYKWPEEPVEKLQKKCEKKDNRACRLAAQAFFNGDGIAVNHAAGEKLLKKACNGDDYEACSNLASLYLSGFLRQSDMQLALSFWEKACAGGLSEACGSYATFYRVNARGLGKNYDRDKVEAMEKKAKELDEQQVPELQKACKKGVSEACFKLYFKNNAVNNVQYLLQACNMGNVAACDYYVYEVATDGSENIKDKLFGMYDKLCQKGEPAACYERCLNINDDLPCLKEACENAYAEGCNQVAHRLLHDDEKKHLKNDIYDYYRRGCVLNDRLSCEALAGFYSEEVRELSNLAAKYRQLSLKSEYNDRHDVSR